ncbi:MAG: glycosyltransferase [Cyanobacteria bacterium J06639_1]
MAEVLCTVVVVPRDRFGCTRASLDALYRETSCPFELIYVDAGSPASVSAYLAEQARDRGFTLLRSPDVLFPNQARNLAIAYVKTRYVVFLDNDVRVTSGWLQALVQCASDTEADVVTPLIALDGRVHSAGGATELAADGEGWRLQVDRGCQDRPLAEVKEGLTRCAAGLADFHCILFDRDFLQRMGSFDERMANTQEQIDMSLTVGQLGGEIVFEPSSLVHWEPHAPLAIADLFFFMVRWSDAFQVDSLHHLRDKWRVREDDYFTTRYQSVGWQRHEPLLDPIAARYAPLDRVLGKLVPWKDGAKPLRSVMLRVERALNRYLSQYYARRQTRSTREASARHS